MNIKQRRNFTVGVFVILAILLFIIAVYLIGKKEYLFGSPAKISAVFYDVKGLKEGDKVRLSGIDIGTISFLDFMADNKVLVEISIDRRQLNHIPGDSHVTIGSQGLMGSKVAMIIPGSRDSGPVNEFDTLSAVEQIDIDDIIREVNRSGKNIAIVSEELVNITQKINRGDGVFGKIFTDTTLTVNLDNAIRNISEITENLYDITDLINRGQSIIGKIFADTSLTSEIGSAGQNMDEIASNLREITDKINKGEGIFGKMFTDTSLTQNLYLTSKNLLSTTNSLSDVAEKLNNDSSALGLLIDNPSFADSLEILLDKVKVGVEEVTEAADAVQRSGLIRLFSRKKK